MRRKEMILTAYRVTGIVKRYGSEELSTLYILLNDTDEDVLYFNGENGKWGLCSTDSYWGLYESEIMMTVMRSVSPEEAIEILEEKCALSIVT